MLITDGVFSMDGDVAPLDKLYEVAERYGVITMVDRDDRLAALRTALGEGLTPVDVAR